MIYNYDNYYFLLVPYYYYILPFKTSKHVKKNHLIKSFDSVAKQRKKKLKSPFFCLIIFLPLLNPRYSRFTVQIFPISKNQNKKK
jgi:hypothetical protein